MKGDRHYVLTIFIMSCILAIMILPGFSSAATINVGTGQTYVTLEDAVKGSSDGDTLQLSSNIDVTRTAGNLTAIDKTLTLLNPTDNQYSINMNGTIAFSGSGKTITFFNNIPFVYDTTVPLASFRNASLFEITATGFTTDVGSQRPSLNTGSFTGTAINISGNSNTISRMPGVSSATGLSIVLNISGSNNDLDFGSTDLKTTANNGKAIDLVGNFNTIKIDSKNRLNGPGGKIWIESTATGNTISEVTSSTYSLPSLSIYNGTNAKTTNSWYFFNASWAPAGGNRNLTIAVSQAFALSGNVTFKAGFSNITGQSTDFLSNSSQSLSSTGYAGGILTNDTRSLRFNSISTIIPLSVTYGNNTYQSNSTQTNLGYVTLLNFNPYNSLPDKNFNATATTNWSTIQDFSAAPNVTFVIENPATHTPLGNISFNQNIDLLDSTLISTGLQSMGQNLNISTTGNSTNLSVTSSGLSVFNKPATITVYPTGFTFFGKRDINITVIPDGSSSPTTLFDHNSWINRAGYVDNSANVTVGSSSISLPVLHFSRYDFSLTANTSPITISLGPGGDFSTLEEALLSAGGARENDTLSLNLNSDIYVTKTAGNLTFIDKTLNLTSNGNKILVNGTIAFNGTGKAWTYTDAAWFSYNNPSAAPLRNNSLIEIPGSSNFFNGTMPTIDAGSFSGTGVNITGNSNTLNAMWNISGSAMPIVVNLTGSSNTMNIAGNLTTTRTIPNGIAVNLLGNTNTLTLNSQNLSAPGGRIWIGSTATGNTISDSGFIFPNIYLYNGTSVKSTTAWYFFNASWSPSGRNQNPVINVSQTIPLAGNVSLISRFVNVTGQSTDLARNTSLALTTTGLAGGNIFNDTSALKFNSVSAIVPVNLSFGDNTYAGSYQQKSLGSVTVLNFNPVNSLPAKNFNVTRTTNWSFVSDFTAARNLTFVIEEPSAHTLLGNISYNQDLDLTDPAIGTGLSALSSNLNMAAAGNSINLNVANTHQAFNKSATLTVYPTGFAFSSGSDIKITATTDSGTPTVLFNNGVWLNRAGFVDANNNVTIGSGNITLPVLHFSKFDFDQSTGGGGGGSTGGEGAGGGSSAGAPSSGIGTVTVNTQGSSAITQVEVTGVGVENIIVGAWAFNILPSSVTPATTAVYQYIAVIPNQYTEISNAIISFSVQKSWLEKNGYTKYDMTIMRYSDGVWTPLPTVIVGEDLDFVKYQATSPGLSHFAIVYMKDAAVQAPVNVTATQTPVSTITVNVTETQILASMVTGKVTETQTPASTIPVNAVPAQSTREVSPTTQKTPGFNTPIAIAAAVSACGGAWVASRKKRMYR